MRGWAKEGFAQNRELAAWQYEQAHLRTPIFADDPITPEEYRAAIAEGRLSGESVRRP